MPYSYAGRLLRVDLSSNEWHSEGIEDALVKKYLLGGGLAARLYYDEMEPAREPLDPDSSLILMIGVLSGTVVPSSCRLCFCGRSPLPASQAIACNRWVLPWPTEPWM